VNLGQTFHGHSKPNSTDSKVGIKDDLLKRHPVNVLRGLPRSRAGRPYSVAQILVVGRDLVESQTFGKVKKSLRL